MKRILFIFILFFLSGCTTINDRQQIDSCRLVEVAVEEGVDLSSTWYTQASTVLQKCGNSFAADKATRAVCFAEQKNDNTKSCPF